MNNTIEKVIDRIVNIPSDYHQSKTKTLLTLLDESGYIQVHEQIQENEIIGILKRRPHLIAEWLQWSDDQRWSPTTYFTKGEDGKCFVGHTPEIKEFKEINTSNEFYACAVFIKYQVENIRGKNNYAYHLKYFPITGNC